MNEDRTGLAAESLCKVAKNLEHKMEARERELRAANDELTAQNEEMIAMNEELAALNTEISELNHNLDELNRTLEQRVEEKTADLMAAHQELTAQYAELIQSQETLQQNAKMQAVLREIAEYAISAPSLIALYEKVHRLIEQVLPAKNFYISLLDEAGSQLVVPYCVDETNTIPLLRPVRKGLTDYVMRLRKPLQVTPEALQMLWDSGEVEVRLIHYRQWAGAPLMDASGKAFGVNANAILHNSGEEKMHESGEKSLWVSFK